MRKFIYILSIIVLSIILIFNISLNISNDIKANSPEKSVSRAAKHHKFKLRQNERCLVIAPHPDDESIGCGGLLIKYGAQCDVVVLTDGRFGDKSVPIDEEIKIRKEELKQAMDYAGVNSYKQLDIMDTKVKYSLNKLKQINLKDYNYVFVPNKYEEHADHAAVYNEVKKLLRFSKKTKLVSYEVWTPMPYTNYYLDISDIFDKKVELIKIYKSQMNYVDYTRGAEGINKYRGMIPHKAYAEAFYIE